MSTTKQQLTVKNKTARFIIGCDPDLHRSGCAIYDRQTDKLIECTSIELWCLFDSLLELKSKYQPEEYFVRLEYPENTNTYHKGGKGAALNLGKNQAIAILIAEFMDYYEMPYEKVFPCGFSQTFKDEDFFKRQTGFTERTNSDGRASAAMCWRY